MNSKNVAASRLYHYIPSLFILLILVSACALRVYNFKKFDLWYDEIISLQFCHQRINFQSALSGRSVPSIIFERLQTDPNPPLYYFLIYVCSFFLKIGKSLRLLSIIFSTFSLVVFYKLARLMYDRSTSIVALLLMAINPFQIWYAQEMRGYAISGFFSLLATLFFFKLLRKEKKVYLIYFLITEVFALLTSYYSIFMLIVALIFLLFKRNFAYAKILFLFIIVGMVFCVLFLGTMLGQIDILMNSFWLRPPVFRNILQSFSVFALGYSANYIQLIIGTVIFVVLCAYGIYASLIEKRESSIFMIISFLLPIMIVFVISRLIVPVYIDRQFIVVTHFYYLFIARGISGIRNIIAKLSIWVVLAVLILSLLTNYYNGFILPSRNRLPFYPGVQEKMQYASLLTYLSSSLDKDDIIAATDFQSYQLTLQVSRDKIFDSTFHWFLFYPKTLTKAEKSAHKVLMRTSRDMMRDTPDALYRFYFDSGKPCVERVPFFNKTIKRIWLVTSFLDKARLCPLNDNHPRIKERLLRDYQCEELKVKDGIMLEKFIRK